MNAIDHLPEVRRLRGLGWGNRRIGAELGIGKDAAQRLLKKLELEEVRSNVEISRPMLASEPRTAAEYVERITARWRSSVEAIIEAGRLLTAAKAALAHGEFLAMIERQLPFGASTAQRLMAIAADRRLTTAAHGQHLPPHWRTLYELTKLDDEQFQVRISDGTIKPDMERSAVAGIVKAERRANREITLGGLQAAANLRLPQKRYGVILADPPWRFEPYSRDTGMDRAADNHYPTSSVEEICRLPVVDIAASDCVLFLWATAPILPGALEVMAAWGFAYKSHCIWRKDRAGTGFWFRSVHELLLVGTRGTIPAPAPEMRVNSVLAAPTEAHSVKPELVQEWIGGWYPNLPRIELYARRARPGWDRWGLEAPSTSAQEAAE